MSSGNGKVKGKTLRLLKKGHKGLVYALFSRFGLVVLMLLVQIAMIVVIYNIFKEFVPHYYGISMAFSAFMVLVLINSRMDPTSKVTWLVIINAGFRLNAVYLHPERHRTPNIKEKD